MPRGIKGNRWKQYATGEDRETVGLKNWIRDICRTRGYSCEEERFFTINYHDTNELAEDKEYPYPVDLYISDRRDKEFIPIIVEIDGEYHDNPKQQAKDTRRDAAIKARYDVRIRRFGKKALLKEYTEERLVEELEYDREKDKGE